ncbi:MAG TPA: Clp protease ClpP [Candidatus Fimivicinus intestinavium]|nr:Clp protease ClpP [Candidatus Fimivicinus intestinavium]
MKFWNIVRNEETGSPEIRIEGPIQMEESLWAWFLGQKEQTAKGIREEIREMDGKDIVVWINSTGGECIAASVIYTALREHKGKVTVKIDGSAISAASVIAMAGDEILMAPTSVMMIHNPLTYAEGEVKDMEKAIEILTEVKETIISAYAAKTGKPRKEIARLMDEETWMGARKAVEMGFADGVLYDQEETDDLTVNGIVRGMSAIYNSLGTGTVNTKELLRRLDPENKKWKMAKAQLAIEQNRF